MPDPDALEALAVGDKLFAVPTDNRRGNPSWLTITKVGRKWLTLANDSGFEWGRCDRETLAEDAGAYSARYTLYRSEEEWRLAKDRREMWSKIHSLVRNTYAAPAHLSLEQLRDILRALASQQRNGGGGAV